MGGGVYVVMLVCEWWGEVAGLTVKNSPPWNNIWIGNSSHIIFLLILNIATALSNFNKTRH